MTALDEYRRVLNALDDPEPFLLERSGLPDPFMERWMRSDDPDVRWVMRQSLTKKRLTKAGADWVASWSSKLGHGS
jgi:hypothetical protein